MNGARDERHAVTTIRCFNSLAWIHVFGRMECFVAWVHIGLQADVVSSRGKDADLPRDDQFKSRQDGFNHQSPAQIPDMTLIVKSKFTTTTVWII